MKRWAKAAVLGAVAFGVGMVSEAWCQGLPAKKEEEQLHFYVVAEKRGLDVVCTKLTSFIQVKEKTTTLEQERQQTLAKNATLNREVLELKKKLPGLKAALGLKKDEAEKEAVQKQIDEVEGAIKEKQGEMKPPVQYVVSRSFSKSEDADAYMDAVEADARAVKERAEKEAAAKEKAGKK